MCVRVKCVWVRMYDRSIVQDQLSLAYIYTRQYTIRVGIVNAMCKCASLKLRF